MTSVSGCVQSNFKYVKNLTTSWYLKHRNTFGAWIAEWSSHLTFELQYATPWAMSLCLSDVKLFFGPKHNIYALFVILFGLFDLILLFVCQICHVNCEAEN